nr:macro domain-containing protein [Marinicella sp. NBU2979]
MRAVNIELVTGDLLAQPVDVIVNSWNRNIIPWWLLIPQGVSGAIKKQAGTAPFKELAKMGPIPLGAARETGAGRLNFKSIIHVAGINLFWLATKNSIAQSVINAMNLVNENGYCSVALPLIGAGSGQRSADFSQKVIINTLEQMTFDSLVKVVRYEV